MDKYNSTIKVSLPGWEEDKPFEAVLRRPSLLTMAAEGSIPNELIGAAQKLFCEGYDETLPLDRLGRLLYRIASEALVEPTLERLESEGCRLTDIQLAAIYNFSQAGVRALEPFRLGGGAAQPACDEQKVRRKTQPDAGRG